MKSGSGKTQLGGTGSDNLHDMVHWIITNKLSCYSSNFAGDIMFPGRKVFFAGGATGGSGSSGNGNPNNPNAKNKKTTTGDGEVDDLTNSMSNIIDSTMFKNTANELENKLTEMKKASKISPSVYELAKRLSGNHVYNDQELVKRLVDGNITQGYFKKFASYLHPETGDAADRYTMRSLAEYAISRKLPIDIFDKAALAVESDSADHKKAVDALLKNPQDATKLKTFNDFMLDHPLSNKKANNLFGDEALDVQQGATKRQLSIFMPEREIKALMKAMRETPEDAVETKKYIKEFEENSAAHGRLWDELNNTFNTQVAKNDTQLQDAFSSAISNVFPDPIHPEEKDITLDELRDEMRKTGLDKKIPAEMLKSIQERIVTLQTYSRKALAAEEKVTKKMNTGLAEAKELIVQDQNKLLTIRRSGISLEPGTKIRYRKAAQNTGNTEDIYEWKETEIQGVIIDDETNEDGTTSKVAMIHIEGEEAMGLSEFAKWVVNTQASQIVKSTSAIEKELEFDIFGIKVKEGSAFEYRNPAAKADDAKQHAQIKIKKISGDTIELDQPVFYTNKNDTIEGKPQNAPTEKTTFTLGEFARWMRKNQAMPYMKTANEAQQAYKKWKEAKNLPGELPFKKGQFITYGPYGQDNMFLVTDEKKNEDGEDIVCINNIEYRASELMVTAMNNHWEPINPQDYATHATAHITDPIRRAEAHKNARQSMLNRQIRLAQTLDADDVLASLISQLAPSSNATAGHAAAVSTGTSAPASTSHVAAAAHGTSPAVTTIQIPPPSGTGAAASAVSAPVSTSGSHGPTPPSSSSTPSPYTPSSGSHMHVPAHYGAGPVSGGSAAPGHGSTGGGHGAPPHAPADAASHDTHGGSGHTPPPPGGHAPTDAHDGDAHGGDPHDTAHDAHDAHGDHHSDPLYDEEGNKLLLPNLETVIADHDPAKIHEAEKKFAELQAKIAKGTDTPSQNALREFYVNTHILSANEMWQLAKAVWEYWNRTWERKMKGRFSKFGANLPFIGTEMLRIKEETEHHEVGQYKEAITAMGIIEIRGILNGSSNADQIKACIEVLVEKGQMRWDDVRTWEAMNRIPNLPGANKIPIPKDRNPYTAVGVDEKNGSKKFGIQYFGKAIDKLWGDAIFDGWQGKNSGAYDSGMRGFAKQGDEMENDPYGSGQIGGKLKEILKAQMSGEWANPQEYEGFIRYAIENGKTTIENKLYFMVMGVATRILTLERMGAIANDLQNNLPFLAFFGDQGTKKPYQHVAGPYTVEQYKMMASEFYHDPGLTEKAKGTAGPRVKDFLWKHVINNNASQVRTIKAIRNGEAKIDHDDSHTIIPLLDDEWVQQVCSHSGGRKKYFTIPGYTNAYPGFSEWMRSLANTFDPKAPKEFAENAPKLIQTLKSFVKYNGILSSRFKKGDENYQRLSPDYLEKPTVVDALPVKYHKQQLEGVIMELGNTFGIAEAKLLYEDTPDFKTDDAQKKKQLQIEDAHEKFGKKLEAAIKSDPHGMEKLVRVIQGMGLLGYRYSADPEVQEQAKKNAEKMEQAAENAEVTTKKKPAEDIF